MRPDPEDRRALVAFALLGALKALALVLVAEGVAGGIGAVVDGADWMPDARLIVAGGILRAFLAWAGSSLAARAAIGEKERLRRALAGHVLSHGGRPSTAVLGSLGLDELDAYYRSVLPAIASVATIPLLVGARILFADWVSALVVVLTVPLVPLFMALVGLHTKDRADAASATLQRLSDHMAELARGLPVLVGLGRVSQQSAALRRISTDHRATTMATLRAAFLSSLVLELIATISVAIVAVFVGIRLLSGELPLEIGLLALVLAPECFAPFRELGAAFHAAQDGRAARRVVLAAVGSTPVVAPVGAPALAAATAHGIAPLSFTLRPNSTTTIDGPSGSGKSTVLALLAGVLEPEAGHVVVASRVAYVPQHPHTVGETVLQELEYYGEPGDVLARLGLEGLEQVDPARLSPGELRRLAVARALLRVEAGARLLLLDEPTAHLDAASAELVRRELAALTGRVTMVIASHEAEVAELADERIVLGASTRRSSTPSVEAVEAPLRVEPTLRVEPSLRVELVETGRSALRAFLRPVALRFAAAAAVGTAAALFAIALTAVSGWLIVRASEETAIMYLLVAIVGVRFFGLGRAALRYSERLLTHDAVLAAVTELRMRLWAGLAANGLASRELSRGGIAIDYLVGAADAVRDLVPRVILPPVVAALTSIGAVIAVGVLHPVALVPLVMALLVALVAAPVAALLGDRVATASERELRSTVLRRFVALVGAAADLRANGVGDRVRDEITSLDAAAGRRARRTALARGLGAAVTTIALTSASAAMLSVGADGPITGVLVLLAVALIDPLLAHVEAVQQWPALRAALAKTAGLDVLSPTTGTEPVGHITALALPGVPEAAVGDWLVIEGASGSGKSLLLSELLGYRPAPQNSVLINGTPIEQLDVDQVRARVAWCPQEAHVFDSTVRGNLALGRRATDDEYRAVLSQVGLHVGLDQRTGPEGSHLSGGQRQRLAVARTLLVDSDVVLLDEPTAHLDGEAAEDLVADLRRALADRIVVLVTHHASERRGSDILLRLGGSSLVEA